MTLDDDLAEFNKGLDSVFQDKPIAHQQPERVIRDEVEKSAWQKRRTRRTHSDTYSMVMSYSHHEGDRRWLVDKLTCLPMMKREPAMMKYAQIYEEALQREQDENRRQGEARRGSNSWLVELVDKQ